MIYISEIAGVLLNSFINTEDYKLLILKYITAIIIRLIVYKSITAWIPQFTDLILLTSRLRRGL